MSVLNVKEQCCGCRNCINVCPQKAVRFKFDKAGFEYPDVDNDKCINCGLCEKCCPVLNAPIKSDSLQCFYSFSKDNVIRKSGSSGGLFGVFASKIIEKGGVVFGAAFDEKLALKTTKAETLAQLTPLFKSKYLLSDTSNSFFLIRDSLQSGKMVLYCSSPCQISALKLFLKKDYDNLITVEFVCHGVGNQRLFNDSISYLEKKNGYKIKNFLFRFKEGNKTSHYYKYTYEKAGKIRYKTGLYFDVPFYNAYCHELIYREGCYSCKYATTNRVADLTIGDFHRILKYDSNIDRFSGVSMLLINSIKGRAFFNECENDLIVKPITHSIVYKENRFSTNNIIPQKRKDFIDLVGKTGFVPALKKTIKPGEIIKKRFFYSLPYFIRKVLSK